MGVYIKGLEMPEKCINCKFCVDMNEYPFHACFITYSDIPFDIDKLKNCPLVDLVTCGECKYYYPYKHKDLTITNRQAMPIQT